MILLCCMKPTPSRICKGKSRKTQTKYMLFHSPRKRLPDRNIMEVRGCVIGEVAEYSLLGLQQSSTMKWIAHVNMMRNNLSSICGIFRRIAECIPKNWMMKLYHVLFHSRLQYLVTCWWSASKSTLKEIQVHQNRCRSKLFNELPTVCKTSATLKKFKFYWEIIWKKTSIFTSVNAASTLLPLYVFIYMYSSAMYFIYNRQPLPPTAIALHQQSPTSTIAYRHTIAN